MAPFPETEIMTIKRLDVALRKMDYKLLKDGAYKLHEKYHSGYKFECINDLKEILMQTTNNSSIPNDIKDILCPTINDILANSVSFNGNSDSNHIIENPIKEERPLMPDVEKNDTQPHKLSAFDVFGASKTGEDKETESNVYVSKPINNQTNSHIERNYVEESNCKHQTNPLNYEVNNTEEVQMPVHNSNSLSTIAIYYGQDNSKEKIKNILNYREIIAKFEDEHYSISQILKLISEINIQSDTNVSELKNILDQIKISGNKLNLVTNSSSRELIDLFEKEEYSYSIYENDDSKQMTFIPVFGLSNRFECLNCKEEYIDKNNHTKSLIMECPTCKSPMFPSLYAADKKNNQINMAYYNNALVSLANSKVWVLIHPSTEDKLFQSMLINVFKLNKDIKNVYILEKDINLREAFRREFASINEEVQINVQMSALEDFINSLR